MTDTGTHLNALGGMVDQTVTTTSADGTIKTTQFDSTGILTNGKSVFDRTLTDTITVNGNGSSPL